VRYGGGDWNDSLQPVSKDIADRLISSWTVEMNYQAFRQYAEVCSMAGATSLAGEMNRLADQIRIDFNICLVSDGVVAGYGLSGDDGSISLLLHPSDTVTGIRYSLLPMERGIVSGIFTPEQAAHHLELIGSHLTGPDGARLMDRPLRYSGGPEKIFRRAESSTFFGREIGLMYVHEHIRYAEALSIAGRADDFLAALRQAVPADYRQAVQCGDIRQSNCYYSSSDVIFRTRYEADEQYEEVITGKKTLRGGWRTYSSGPGIFTAIVFTRLFGIRQVHGSIILDPVLPLSLDGIVLSARIMDHTVRIKYLLKKRCSGPEEIIVNSRSVAFTREENNYRPGGAVIDAGLFKSMMHEDNLVTIIL
jgi:cellobiose phosphorylase